MEKADTIKFRENHKENTEMFKKLSTLEKGSTDYIKLRNEIVQANLGLAERFASSIWESKEHTGYYEYEDVLQASRIGLIVAVEKYDYTRTAYFSSYANFWLFQYFKRMYQDNRLITIPDKVANDYCAGKEMHASVINACERALDVGSLEEMYEAGEDEEQIDFLSDKEPNDISLYGVPCEDNSAEEMAMKKLLVETMTRVLNGKCVIVRVDGTTKTTDFLTERQKKILLKYYSDDKMTLQEVSSEFGITRERTRQIIAHILRKLRHPSRSRYIRDFL